MSRELLCYNRGCGKTFNIESNAQNSCLYHPGSPFFHDAYKGWTCCNRKSIDFTEFLNMKGCTSGYHSNIKPIEPEIKKDEIKEVVEEKSEIIRPPVAPLIRPHFDTLMTKLELIISPNLEKKAQETIEAPTQQQTNENKICENSGCNLKFCDENKSPLCTYHPGEAIFHEGLKYWSCCKKKAMDFDEFLKQKGCKEGSHCWESKKNTKAVECRFDWHQTGSDVIATIYSKGYDFRTVKIKANPVRVHVAFSLQNGIYEKEWTLNGIIDCEKSKATLLGTKIEISLKKAEAAHWTQFEL